MCALLERLAAKNGIALVTPATNAELESALCELDEAIEARFAEIEDALCELDEGGSL